MSPIFSKVRDGDTDRFPSVISDLLTGHMANLTGKEGGSALHKTQGSGSRLTLQEGLKIGEDERRHL